jgi:uncharacterized protein
MRTLRNPQTGSVAAPRPPQVEGRMAPEHSVSSGSVQYEFSSALSPVAPAERNVSLDVLRGAALLGVLMVNLLDAFRVPLCESILTFHTHPGQINRAVDILTAWLFEFKAFTLFSFLLGVGVGLQFDRAVANRVNASRFLVRRFGVLLAIGFAHMMLIWSGDILALYAVCGVLLIPFAGLSSRRLWVLGILTIASSPYLPFFGALFPSDSAMRANAAVATRVYGTGSFQQIMAFRFSEAVHFVLPLLINSLPRTFGLMLLGIAAWRSGLLRYSVGQRKRLRVIVLIAGSLGALMTTFQVWSKETGQPPPSVFDWVYPYGFVLLAAAYGAMLLLWSSSSEYQPRPWHQRLLEAAGRMALTNYLGQSVIFSVLFYGFGFGLIGKLAPATAACLGVAVCFAQLIASNWWLRRYRFGPVEWLWRSLTYGRLAQMRHMDIRDITV